MLALVLGKGVEGVSDSAGGGGRMCNVLDREVVEEKEEFVVWGANRRILVSSPPPLMNSSWTQHMHQTVGHHIFFTD